MTATERNAHYGKLNVRFDERAKGLISRGFKYQHVPALEIGVFTITKFGRVKTLAASLVMNADDIVWSDTMESVDRFCA